MTNTEATTAAREILAGHNATSVTTAIVALAVEGALRPEVGSASARVYRLYLNGHGEDALFGAIDISAKHGRILRAFLTHGNAGREQRYDTVPEIRAILRAWTAHTLEA